MKSFTRYRSPSINTCTSPHQMPPQSSILTMEMLHKSQLAKALLLVFFVTLLILTPLVSPSMRSSYLYFLLNLLIIVLGIEAGLLSSMSSKPDEYNKKPAISSEVSNSETSSTDHHVSMHLHPAVQPMTIEKPITAENVKSLKRCKSRPSLFFIASCEPETEELVEKEEGVAVKRVVGGAEELSKQELFIKADMFIGNFYKQLRMQRENSWQKLHGLYRKTF